MAPEPIVNNGKKTKNELLKEISELRQELVILDKKKNRSSDQKMPDDKDQIFQMITENVSDLIAILDLDGKRVYNSKSYKSILGDPARLKGTDSFREVYPEDQEKIKRVFEETVKTGIGQRAEYRMNSEDGSIRTIESQGNVIRDNQGKIKNIIVVSRDITDREAIEKALHDSEERLKSILKAIPDIIYRLDPDGNITFMSEAISSYGYEVKELLGKNIIDLVHPADKEKAIYRINERRTGERRTKSFEIRLLTAKGKAVLFEDRSKSVQMEPVFLLEAEGLYATDQPLERNFMGTQGIARDITELKKATEDMTILAQALKCISECVSVTDLNNNIIFINDAFLKTYGYGRQELMGKPISIVRSETESSDTYQEILPSSLNGGWKGEIMNRKKDGTEFPIHLSTAVIYEPNGFPVALIGVATDITERKHLETQLQQSQKLEAIGKLAGGVAHDFNNLLTVIQGYSELLLAQINANDPISEQIRQINHAAGRAESLTRQLLAFSRKQIMQPRVIDLNQLIRDMEDMLRRLIGADIEFSLDLRKDLGKIKADRGQIEQVIMNLAVNARDAMKNGGQLTIGSENIFLDADFRKNYPEAVIGSYVNLSMTDTGSGMDKETQVHIFEPFFTTKEKGEGTGLGLATVYGIIKQSGGYIYVQSEKNQGTTFFLYFPRVDEPLDSDIKTARTDNKLSGTETILVVEDQDEVRQLIVESLKHYGYHVFESPHGGSALLTCEQNPDKVDLIITDMVMPQMNGQQMVRRLLPLQPRAKVLFFSGYSEEMFTKQLVLDPGMVFIQKPFTPMELLRKIREILDSEKKGPNSPSAI
jgi:PAS domain S-box-containing protein